MSLIRAATVVLLRQATAPEVFLVRRHGKSGFMGGATVFPGGKVDAVDADTPSCGRTPAACAAALNIESPDEAHAYFVAAIRELHEEAHVILARDRAGNLPAAEAVAALNDELDSLREGHRIPNGAVRQLWEAHGLRPALDLVAPFAWWVTPVAEPRRFDTRFFVGLQPEGQRAAMDGHETTAERWATATDAIAAHEAGGDVYLPPPTLHTLHRISELPGGAQDVFAALATGGSGPCILPHYRQEEPGTAIITLPDDGAHPGVEASGKRNRFVLRNGRFYRLVAGEGLL